jgi:energy-coupling factor transporter ATP-binding protein EcfA2
MKPKDQDRLMVALLRRLSESPREQVAQESDTFRYVLGKSDNLHRFVEDLYDYWRSFERFFVYYSDEREIIARKKPARAFNATAELLNALVRKVYRDICENITGNTRRIYRQIAAGCQVALIVKQEELDYPKAYAKLKNVNVIKQVLIEPPLIIDPPMNKREGKFVKTTTNPIRDIEIDQNNWLCYPAKVGEITIHVLFHNRFIGLGSALANLFELGDSNKPNAVYAFGVNSKRVKEALFYDDKDFLFAAAPGTDEYGYFGYVKKMVLTLHNIICMKKGRLPVHGAMVRINLRNGKSAHVVIVGDSGAGKSESIEAFRVLAKRHISDFSIVFDDMGSLDITRQGMKAYGTEVGAFVRLDDLSPGYAFGSIDRSIIMSPQKTNARAILPITTPAEISKGYNIDYFLYANNYEEIDNEHPHLEKINSAGEALKIFGEGARMAKGTTSEKGLVHTYFANLFGPPQYRELHDRLARKYFNRLFAENSYVGQLRTRLGIEGYETKGPETAARALLRVISESR